MESALVDLLAKLAAGGPATGWLLSVYLLLRLHQLTDRQHKANLATVKTLTAIKVCLLARFGGGQFTGEDL